VVWVRVHKLCAPRANSQWGLPSLDAMPGIDSDTIAGTAIVLAAGSRPFNPGLSQCYAKYYCGFSRSVSCINFSPNAKPASQ